jgi:hypothetical protein
VRRGDSRLEILTIPIVLAIVHSACALTLTDLKHSRSNQTLNVRCLPLSTLLASWHCLKMLKLGWVT